MENLRRMSLGEVRENNATHPEGHLHCILCWGAFPRHELIGHHCPQGKPLTRQMPAGKWKPLYNPKEAAYLQNKICATNEYFMACCGKTETELEDGTVQGHHCTNPRPKPALKLEDILTDHNTLEYKMSNLPAFASQLTREMVTTLMLDRDASRVDLDVHYLMGMKARSDMNGIPTPDFVDFIHKAQKLGADPVKEQIYLIPYNGRKKINGQWRDIVEGTTVFAYNFFISRAKADENFGGWAQETIVDDYFDPETCESTKTLVCRTTITYKDGTQPSVYEAWYPEFVRKKKKYVDGVEQVGQMEPTAQWKKPKLMLAKCSLCNGLRQAFPASLSGMRSEYDRTDITEKEVDLSGEEAIEVKLDESVPHVDDPVDIKADAAPEPIPTQGRPEKADNPNGSILGKYKLEVGKHKGQLLESMEPAELASYSMYWRKKGEELGGKLATDLNKIDEYLLAIEYNG